MLCRHRLETRDRWNATTFHCELPDDHEGLHRSLLLTEGYEKAFDVTQGITLPTGEMVDGTRRETTDVIVAWKHHETRIIGWK